MVRRRSEGALATVAVAALLLAGCGGDDQPASARMTVDDGALPVGASGPQLSPGFDRSTNELTKVLPVQQLRAEYTDLVPMAAESLVPSEASGCKPDAVLLPSLPATEVLATRPPAAGAHEPEVASVVAARAPSEKEAGDLLDAVRKAAADCADFAVPLKDLGEGSVAPGEKGASTVQEATVGDWAGVRVTTSVAVSGRNWQQDVVRQSIVVRKGQVVVHVHAEQADEAEAAGRVDELSNALIAAIDGDDVVQAAAAAPASPAAPAPTQTSTGAATPTAPSSRGTRPTGQPAPRTRPATATATGPSQSEAAPNTPEPTGSRTEKPAAGDGDGAIPVP